jgi:hypothetical protein
MSNITGFILWDLKDQIDINEVNDAVQKGARFFYSVDSGGDEYAVVWSQQELAQEEAQEVWDDEILSRTE